MAAHVLDRELQKRLLDLAEEYERKAAELIRDDPNSRLGPTGGCRRAGAANLSAERLRALAARAPRIAEDLSRIAEDLENETAKS